MASSDLAVTYAALILADAGQEITASQILALTEASGADVEPIWASLMAKALAGKDIKSLLTTVATTTSSTQASPAQTTAGKDKDADKEKEKDVEVPDDGSDSGSDFGGFGLFDD